MQYMQLSTEMCWIRMWSSGRFTISQWQRIS